MFPYRMNQNQCLNILVDLLYNGKTYTLKKYRFNDSELFKIVEDGKDALSQGEYERIISELRPRIKDVAEHIISEFKRPMTIKEAAMFLLLGSIASACFISMDSYFTTNYQSSITRVQKSPKPITTIAKKTGTTPIPAKKTEVLEESTEPITIAKKADIPICHIEPGYKAEMKTQLSAEWAKAYAFLKSNNIESAYKLVESIKEKYTPLIISLGREQKFKRFCKVVQSKYERNKSLEELVGFIWPVNLSKYSISSGFGLRKDPMGGNGTNFHKGIDIATQLGTKVRAISDGIVQECGNDEVRGIYVVINHGDSIRSEYLHLQHLKITPGTKVQKGQIIAQSGKTGRVTGPHLHLGFKVDGKYVDPKKYLKSWHK